MLLSRCAIDDPMPGMTKRHRLFAALKARQERDGYANNVVAFVQQAMDPVRYTQARLAFDQRRAPAPRAQGAIASGRGYFSRKLRASRTA
jgi:hypothetical protein